MAFGVYAAASVSYTTNGSVSFKIADVYVDVTSTLNKVVGGAVAQNVSGVEASSYTGGDQKTFKALNADKNFGDIALTNVNDYVEVVCTITNKNSIAIYVKFEVTQPTDTTNLTTTVACKNDKAEVSAPGNLFSLASGKTATLTLKIVLKNNVNEIANTNGGYSIIGTAQLASE
jgi:hypothetical protein